MPGQTSPDDLVFPLIGDNASPRVAITQLADSVQAALNDIHAGADRQVDFYGPTAALTSTAPKQGDTYRESDSLKRLWIYDGANWVTNEGGMYLIRPASVANATVAADGSVIPTAGQSAVQINGVFSSRFRSYVVKFNVATAAAAGAYIRLSSGGVQNMNTSHNAEVVDANGTALSSNRITNASYWPISYTNANNYSGSLEFLHPASTSGVKQMRADTQGAGPSCWYKSACDNFAQNGTAFDGFTHILTTSTYTAEAGQFFKIYGLA